MNKDFSTGSAMIGMGVFSLHSIWSSAAPTLTAVRDAPPQSIHIKQGILDAAILTGGAAIVVGSTAYFMTKETLPAILMIVTFAALAGYWLWVADAENQL